MLNNSEGEYIPAAGPMTGTVSKIDMPDTRICFSIDLAQCNTHSYSDDLVSTEDNVQLEQT